MKYYSTQNKNLLSGFREAVLSGLAPDEGLWFPQSIPQVKAGKWKELKGASLPELGIEIMRPFVTDVLNETELEEIVNGTFSFEIPLRPVHDHVSTLELFHGPTCAFKDLGARFLSRTISKLSNESRTILVATSGDTGSAVANGFLGVEGAQVVLLYPKGRISHLQEQQLTTLGQNITALEVEGSFDDCQDMVKKAFLDKELTGCKLTSANSINLARWIPQGIYHAWGALQADHSELVFAIPSGNFGNLASGLLMYRMGMPVKRFIAATNANNIVPHYLESGQYEPKPSVATISNAMDVGNPSNFVRLLALFEENDQSLQDVVSGFSLNDDETRKVIAKVQEQYGYTCDPHGAVAYAALEAQLDKGELGVFFETAHPAKFGDVVNTVIGKEISIPERLAKYLQLEKKSIEMPTDYAMFKDFLYSHCSA